MRSIELVAAIVGWNQINHLFRLLSAFFDLITSLVIIIVSTPFQIEDVPFYVSNTPFTHSPTSFHPTVFCHSSTCWHCTRSKIWPHPNHWISREANQANREQQQQQLWRAQNAHLQRIPRPLLKNLTNPNFFVNLTPEFFCPTRCQSHLIPRHFHQNEASPRKHKERFTPFPNPTPVKQ